MRDSQNFDKRKNKTMEITSGPKKIWTAEEKAEFNSKIAAMTVGNCMEWYDFAIFGALADIIGGEFFPSGNDSLQLLKSLSVFGAAFLMRPLGGILMGWIGDTVGRKRALEISIALMLIPSFLMGCLPTYQQVGYLGTVLLVLMRLLQGVAVGGELVGAFIFTVEATKGEDRGFWGAICKASGSAGTSLGMGTAAIMRALLTEEQMRQFGWRIPFLIGIIFGLVGVWLRSHLTDESQDEFAAAKSTGAVVKYPIVEVMKSEWREVLLIIMTGSFWGVGFYSCFVWMGYFLSSPSLIGGDAVSHAWVINFSANVALVVAFPWAGILGDTMGRKLGNARTGFRLVMMAGVSVMAVLAVPAFMLLGTRTIWGVLLAELVFIVAMSLFGANLPAYMVSLFPVSLRYTGVGVGYNIANAIFSGTAPLVQTSLVMSRSTPEEGRLLPAYYLTAVSLMSLVGLGLVYPCVTRRQRHLQSSAEDCPGGAKGMELSSVHGPLYSMCVCLEDTEDSTHSPAMDGNIAQKNASHAPTQSP